MTLVTRQTIVDDDGTFTAGTVGDADFFADFYDQIDDQCHSTTNPTVKPKAVTDEVVAARGSKASLDARLDVVLNDDGTLKTQATLVTAAQVQSALGGRNVAVNGDLDDWSAGGAAAPDSFTLAGAGATIARTGVAMADTFHFGTGSGFAAKVTRAGTDWTLTQDVIAAASFANYVNVKGQKVSAAVKGKTAIGSLLRLVIDDGVSTTASSYHTGGGAEEHLSVTHTISNSATKVSVYAEGTGSNGDAYVGGFTIVFADLAPSDWAPLSREMDANSTRRGLVALGTQSIPGQKQFDLTPQYKPGGDSAYDATVSGLLPGSVDTTQHANSGAGLTDLTSYALPANVLNANGKAIRIRWWGSYAANANNKQLFFKFGATTFVLEAGAINGVDWSGEAIIMRTGAATQKVFAESRTRGGGLIVARSGTAAETLANSITIKTQAQGVANNDILQEGFFVEVLG